MTGRRVIQVPDLNESDNFSSHINPHTRFKAIQASKTVPNQKTVLACSDIKQQPVGTDNKKNGDNADVAPAKITKISNQPESAFEAAFPNLKNSKFFEEPPRASSSTVEIKQNEKPKTTWKTNCILVKSSQRGNPILTFIRNIPLEYNDQIPDYILGQTTCALYLSLRYHLLKPDYIHERLKQLGRQFQLRILLVQVDVKDPHHCIKELTKIAILADCTLLLAWSAEEAGKYLEVYKIFENKPPDILMEKQDANPVSKLVDALSSVKSVNRTDAKTLLSTFKSFKNVVEADREQLSFCPGMGPQKATRLYEALREPFLKTDREPT